MVDEFKLCPNCAEQIRFEAILCRFCKAPLDAPPAPPDTPEQQERRRVAMEQFKAHQRRSRPFLALGWMLIVAAFALVVLWAASEETRESLGQHTLGIVAGLALLAGFACLIAYSALRPRYTADECPQCHDFRVRRLVRPGVVTSVKVLRCEDCKTELSRTGF